MMENQRSMENTKENGF